MRKITIVHNSVAPYRHLLFEKLSGCLDLKVYFCSLGDNSRKWDSWPRNYDYEYEILSGILLKTSAGEFNVNPLIVKKLFSNRPHVLVLGGYVDATMWLAFAAGLLLKIPLVVWTEGMKEPQSILGRITRPLRILFLKKSSAIVVPGRLSRKYVISLGADTKSVFVAPNAIDNDLFTNASCKYRSHKEELKTRIGFGNKVVILYVGQLIKRKGVEYLLQAYAKLKQEHNNIALVLLGSGSLELYLKNLVNSLGLQDFEIMPSGLSLRGLVKLYSAADVFVLPTLEDVWGFVINEAMVCGLPVVATCASQAAQEMIRSGENGYIVKEADSEGLYNALKDLIYTPKRRRKMGEKSREIAGHEFDVPHMVVGFLSAIKYCTKDTRK